MLVATNDDFDQAAFDLHMQRTTVVLVSMTCFSGSMDTSFKPLPKLRQWILCNKTENGLFFDAIRAPYLAVFNTYSSCKDLLITINVLQNN